MAFVMRGSFERALNDATVEVTFSYPSTDPECAEITGVLYQGIDVWNVLHQEDQDRLNDSLAYYAKEYDAEERACAAESKWEADREERLFAEA